MNDLYVTVGQYGEYKKLEKKLEVNQANACYRRCECGCNYTTLKELMVKERTVLNNKIILKWRYEDKTINPFQSPSKRNLFSDTNMTEMQTDLQINLMARHTELINMNGDTPKIESGENILEIATGTQRIYARSHQGHVESMYIMYSVHVLFFVYTFKCDDVY